MKVGVRYLAADPTEILSVLCDDYRHRVVLEPDVLPDLALSGDTTIAEWRDHCLLDEAQQLGRSLEKRFFLGSVVEDWSKVLEPAEDRTVGDLCDFLSGNGAKFLKFPSARLFGQACKTAGVFRVVAAELVRKESFVVRPGDPIRSLPENVAWELLGMASLAIPGVVPTPRVCEGVGSAAGRVALYAGFLVVLVGGGNVVWVVAGVALVLAGALLARVCRSSDKWLSFPGLPTVGHFVRLIAAHDRNSAGRAPNFQTCRGSLRPSDP